MNRPFLACATAVLVVGLAACNKEQRQDIDSVGGEAVDAVQAEIAVLKIDVGKNVNGEKEVTNETNTFAKSDTIYASILTTGAADAGALSAKWLFPDGSVIEQKADSGNTGRSGRAVFFIAKPGGLPAGKYTFQAVVNGRDVRSEEITVQ